MIKSKEDATGTGYILFVAVVMFVFFVVNDLLAITCSLEYGGTIKAELCQPLIYITLGLAVILIPIIIILSRNLYRYKRGRFS